MNNSIENVKEATKIFVEKSTVSQRQLEIANSIICFRLSDTALNEIDEIINR